MQKRHVSILAPYYLENDDMYIFLQKRSKTTEILPGYFGFFGGGIENGESSEEALNREIREELSVSADNAELFSRYEFYGSVKNVYVMEVDKDFGNKIVIGEGDYGQFFSESDVVDEQRIINEDKLILNNLFGKIKRNNPFT